MSVIRQPNIGSHRVYLFNPLFKIKIKNKKIDTYRLLNNNKYGNVITINDTNKKRQFNFWIWSRYTVWSKPDNNVQYPGKNMGYDLNTMCSGPCKTGKGNSSCGTCTNTAAKIKGLQQGLDTVCNEKGSREISVGHGMYPGQNCGDCVMLKCVDSSDGAPANATKCKDNTPFLHIRVDNEYGTSQEVSDDSFCKRWGCIKGQQENAAANNYYAYKKVSCQSGLKNSKRLTQRQRQR